MKEYRLKFKISGDFYLDVEGEDEEDAFDYLRDLDYNDLMYELRNHCDHENVEVTDIKVDALLKDDPEYHVKVFDIDLPYGEHNYHEHNYVVKESTLAPDAFNSDGSVNFNSFEFKYKIFKLVSDWPGGGLAVAWRWPY